MKKTGKGKISNKKTPISPEFLANSVTSNKTTKSGNVINVSENDAYFAKADVDANHK